MKLKKYIPHFFLIVTICLFYSCNENKTAKNALTEGTIDFKATVVDENSPMAGFAPSSAIVNFKNNNLQVEMSVMGVLNTSFISKPQDLTLTQMVKFFDIKSACIQSEKDLTEENKDYEIKFEETKETKLIAGYNCKKVIAHMVKNPAEVFDVYYTTDLGKDSINCVGPYKGIKGMLMQYRLKKLGLELCFTATSVKKAEINDEVFEIPSYYKIVTRPEMDKLFADFQK